MDRDSTDHCIGQDKLAFQPPGCPLVGRFLGTACGGSERVVKTVFGARLPYLPRDGNNPLRGRERNDRPLTYVSDDPNELRPITPNSFLRPLSGDTVDLDMIDRASLLHRVNYLQEVRDHLRQRFQSEYLGALVHTRGRKPTTPELKVGDIVIVKSDTAKRIAWPLARIISLAPGRDGVKRVAKLKLANGFLTRAVECLYPLEISAPDQFLGKSGDSNDIEAVASSRTVDNSNDVDDYIDPSLSLTQTISKDQKVPQRFFLDSTPTAVPDKFSSRGRKIKPRDILDL